MEEIPKTFVGIVTIVCLLIIGLGNISGQVTISQAKSTVNDMVTEFENSNYNADVVNTAITNALSNYNKEDEGVKVVIYQTDGSTSTHTAANVEVEDVANASMAKITLWYRYSVVRGTSKLYTVSDYAK